MPGFGQALGHRLGGRQIVLDDQYFHGAPGSGLVQPSIFNGT
jgi:hypothetical protein